MTDSNADAEINLEEWGHPEATQELRNLWNEMVNVWTTFAGCIKAPSLDIGGAAQKGRTVTLDPFPRGVVDIRSLGEFLPFRDSSFRSVILESVVKHVLNPTKVLRESRRVCMPNGMLYLTTPVNRSDKHRHNFSASEILQMIEAAGYKVVRRRGVGLAHRFIDRFLKKLGHLWYVRLSVPSRFCLVLYVVAKAS